ncbi:MAG: hypothetical protein DRO36_03535 [Candidatus Hecatellales archaeon]|nr:MAG: hypothetical protein DRO36_03535 [Candidatus Hecatellales archaeon]
MSFETEVLNLIRKDEATNLLQQLVRIPSPTGEEKAVAEFVYETLKSLGLKTEIFEPIPNRPDVVGFLEGSEGKPTLILNGHLDHVPPGNLEDWTYPPYEGRIVDGKMYGRGAADMKGGLTSMIIAAKAIKEANVQLKGNLILTFAVGEEVGDPGTRYIVVDKGIKGDWGIVTEPTVFKGRFRIGVAERGVAWFKITVKGKSTHASQPHLGVNAISKAGKVVSELEKLNVRLARRKHPLIGASACSVTVIRGGFKENVIPDNCEITVDRRMIPSENPKNAEKEIEKILKNIRKKDPKFRFSMERTCLFEPAEIPSNHEIVRVVRKNLKQVCGYDTKPWGTPYACDARNLINDAGIPAIVFGPGDISNCHCIDEYIVLDEVVDAAKILALTALNLLT